MRSEGPGKTSTGQDMFQQRVFEKVLLIFGSHTRRHSMFSGSLLCTAIQSLVSSSRLDLNVLLSTSFLLTRNLYFLHNLLGHLSHPHKAIGREYTKTENFLGEKATYQE
jgi:hypothetical protein